MRPLETRAARIASRAIFEEIYRDCNRPELISPDPLQFLFEYENARDREAVGLIASSLAYGRVAQILTSVRRVLDTLGDSPAEYLKSASYADHERKLRGFVHRFTDCAQMCAFLSAIGEALRRRGSLEALFISAMDGGIISAMEGFSSALCGYAEVPAMFLLPRPSKGSACKRMTLFLRWMARRDDVDPGCWSALSPSELIVPLDTHMFNISRTLGLCAAKSPGMRAAAEITRNFRDICPEDPVKYDFALTRYGIRSDMTVEELFEKWHVARTAPPAVV